MPDDSHSEGTIACASMDRHQLAGRWTGRGSTRPDRPVAPSPALLVQAGAADQNGNAKLDRAPTSTARVGTRAP
jgi:hypothetical protein